eukprot:TRINITY_DN13967_c0_g1_i1.p1 TRINITY_DN13967_c0_g1~~TRINITY_DN13967_c0_g1_i1.p1  ORF type:complete len:383 (+),score=92.33 TRINITY_DN13967_c0_g1_i1:90-1238(+)
MAAISDDKVAVYDRQLRLWGVQAQQRLLNAKVLIWGLEGSNVEACKNLVLAGIALTLRDHRPVAGADVAFNYFLRNEDLGKNRSECAAKRVQEMNPLCTVSCSTAAPEEGASKEKLKAEEILQRAPGLRTGDLRWSYGNTGPGGEVNEFHLVAEKAVKGFDVVVLGLGVLGYDFDCVAAIDAASREVGSCFILTVSAGELCFFFSNLNEHVMQDRSAAQGAAEPTGPVKPMEPETFSFPAFSEWLNCKPSELAAKKTDDSFLLVSLLASFLRNGGKALQSSADGFEGYCRDTAKCVPNVDGVASMKEAFGHFLVEPLMHVASVLGGLLAQEVIKAITKKDPPMINSVCFNAHTCAALVERIPAAPPVKKRKIEEVCADLLDD